MKPVLFGLSGVITLCCSIYLQSVFLGLTACILVTIGYCLYLQMEIAETGAYLKEVISYQGDRTRQAVLSTAVNNRYGYRPVEEVEVGRVENVRQIYKED